MRSSSNAARAKVLRGASVLPFKPELIATLPAVAVDDPTLAEPARSASDRETHYAWRAGYEAGLAEGETQRAAEHADAMARVSRTLLALMTAASEIESQRAKAVSVAEDDVSLLAFEVAEAVLQRELELASAPGQEAVARALRLVPPQVEVTIRLHPADAEHLRELPGGEEDGVVKGVEGLDEEGRLLTIVADESVEPGGCVAEAGACRVDAQVGTALARVRRLLAGGTHS